MTAIVPGRRWRAISAWLAPALLPLLAGCGSGAGYPSLARQPVEQAGASGLARGCDCPPGKGAARPCAAGRASGSAPVVVPPPAAGGGVDDAVAVRAEGLPALVAQARAAHERFEGQRAAAAAAVSAAAGAAPASAPWLRANQALVGLDRARGEAGSALVELDRFAIDDRLAHALDDPDGTADRPGSRAIRQAVATVGDWVAAEDAVLGPLKQRFVGDQ